MVGFIVIVGAINCQFCHLWELNGRFYKTDHLYLPQMTMIQ